MGTSVISRACNTIRGVVQRRRWLETGAGLGFLQCRSAGKVGALGSRHWASSYREEVTVWFLIQDEDMYSSGECSNLWPSGCAIAALYQQVHQLTRSSD